MKVVKRDLKFVCLLCFCSLSSHVLIVYDCYIVPTGGAGGEEDARIPSAPEMSMVPPFMQAFLLDLPTISPVPTSPPVPPKRIVHLETPQFVRKPFPDIPHLPPPPPRGKVVPHHELLLPRYSDLRKKPEFYLGLATATLRCVWFGIVQSEHVGLQKLFQNKLRPELISQLAWLVQNIGSISSISSSSSLGASAATPSGTTREKREGKNGKASLTLRNDLARVGSEVLEMVHDMILMDSSHHMLHGVLLHEMGLSIKCWSLQIPPTSLSILGRILVCRLQRSGHLGMETSADDQLTVNIWKGCVR